MTPEVMAAAELAAADWNARWPEGTAVSYRSGSGFPLVTAGPAYVLKSGRSVVAVRCTDGREVFDGPVDLDLLIPYERQETS